MTERFGGDGAGGSCFSCTVAVSAASGGKAAGGRRAVFVAAVSQTAGNSQSSSLSSLRCCGILIKHNENHHKSTQPVFLKF